MHPTHEILNWIHIIAGGAMLLLGLVLIVMPGKGMLRHKQVGRAFVAMTTIVVLTAVIVISFFRLHTIFVGHCRSECLFLLFRCAGLFPKTSGYGAADRLGWGRDCGAGGSGIAGLRNLGDQQYRGQSFGGTFRSIRCFFCSCWPFRISGISGGRLTGTRCGGGIII